MSSAMIDNIAIDLVYSQEVEIGLIGSQARSASGRYLSNVDAVKRRWTLQTRPMPKASRDVLINHLESVFYGPVEFWIEEFGSPSNTVLAFVTVGELRSFTLPHRYSLNITIDEE